jgi:DNA polymerase-1
MRLRGVLIDAARKAEVVDEYFDMLEILNTNLERIVLDGVGMHGFNWRSNPDLHTLFYEKLKIPVFKKAGRPTVDRNALEKMESYIIARPIIRHIKVMRDIGKKIGVLRTAIDPDGRIRTSYNIGGTSTGRFSSSLSEFGTGGNLQNVEELLRSIFIADKGMKFAKFDAKAGESFIVGAIEWNLFEDPRYLDACDTGDPHTAAARVCWPKLPWTNNLATDKAIAEQPFYRHHSYRFMCKKLGHGSNYGGKAQTLSEQTQLPIGVVQDFQPKYFLAFPAHLQWHAYVDNTLRKSGTLVSLTGRKRQFWGRRNDDSTLREAIAYDPQCSLADIVNSCMLTIWRSRDATLLFHDHDALTVQYPEDREDEIVPKLLQQLRHPIPLKHNRTLLIPFDCKTGWNKSDYDSKKNPMGLKDYAPNDKRVRPKPTHILDRTTR